MKTSYSKSTVWFFLFLFIALPPAAQTQTGFPSLTPDPRAETYAKRGRERPFSWEDLAEISLWASGAETDIASCMDIIRAGAGELNASPGLPAEPRARCEYILTFMHKKFLKSYSLLQTRMDTLLRGGRYNCVSSAVLYLLLVQSAGIEVQGVMTRDHAFVSVTVNGETIDVETTNAYGFDPGNRKDFHDDFGKLTGFAYVPAKNYRDRTAISPLELVSLILSNRIAEAEKRGLYAEAVPLAISRTTLLKNRRTPADSSAFFEDPRRDLMNRIFNYGAALLKAGKEEDCLRWAAYAGAAFPDTVRWQEFINASVNNRVGKLILRKETGPARDFLNASVSMLSGENYGRLNAMVEDAELMELVSSLKKSEEAENILAAIDAAADRGAVPSERITELRTFVIGKTANLLSEGKEHDWAASIDYVEKALARYGRSSRLEQALEAFRSNLANDYHNNFAAAYNKKNYDEAKRILQEGLTIFPGNRRLLTDKEIMDR
jgi:tetratricopeptide (TPR) repeat protein